MLKKFAVILCLFLFVVGCGNGRSYITEQDFQSIQAGMSRSAVEGKIGEGSSGSHAYYIKKDGYEIRVIVTYKEGRVERVSRFDTK